MKLSQKLLGLAGVALADYACCPYDDYGLPDEGCTGVLPEKTPFAGSAFQANDCKAWEFNADAIFDGNDKCGVNRGQCGFQRQFAWGAAPAVAATIENNIPSQFGISGADFQMDFGYGSSAAVVAAYDPVLGGSTAFTTAYASSTGSRSNTNGWNIGMAPALGAVCKLFVPVPPKHVVQVQVAGVHKDGDAPTMFPGTFKATSAGSAVDGTVFCFSVVNPSEGDINSNGVANGNVNALGTTGNSLAIGDDFANKNSLERQAGLEPNHNFGDFLVGTASGSIDGANDNNNAKGSNFDVVAHFSSEWCTSRNGAAYSSSMIAEMQQSNDYNYGDDNYDIVSNHAHNDIIEKRFAAATYGSTYNLVTAPGYMRNTVTTPTDNNNYRWPNNGAWAAYHSVISCAQYNVPAAGGSPSNGYHVWDSDTRAYVMSVSASDFRQGSTAACTDLNYRFNVRQVGSNIKNCGPGQLPDNDNLRCTWNWNYDNGATEPETFFDRTNNLVFNTWSVGRKRRSAVSHAAADPNALAANAPVLSKVNLAFSFVDGLGTSVTPSSFSADAGSDYVTITGTAALLECRGNNAVTTPYRDNFPDCFFGDELHFEAVYTAPTPTDPRSRINSWFSTVAVTYP